MHKTLIFQIDIGKGTQWLKDTSIDPIRKIFIPSVKNYANKYNYDYKLVNESEYLKRGGNFDFLSTKEKHYSFERYYHFINNYDVTVYLDNDIYILDNASKLPQVDCLMNAPEPEGNSSKIFRKENNISSDVKYYNSGVTMINKKIGVDLQNYMQKRERNKIRSRGKNSDNMMLNEYILDNSENFKELGNEWNYMPFLPNSEKLKAVNFFHFVGIPGKQLILQMLNQNINIEKNLEKIIKGYFIK